MATRFRALAFLVVLFCGAVSHAAAQSSHLRGWVEDETGLWVNDVPIVIEHENGQTWQVWTANGGEYRVPALPPGRCRVIVDVGPAFERVVRSLVLRPNLWEGLVITLKLKQVEAARVEVGSRPRDASVGVTFAKEEITGRPLMNSGGSWQAFLATAPGLVFTEVTFTGAEASAVGQQRSANRVTIDGMNANLYVDVFGLGRLKSSLPAAATSGSNAVLVPLLAIENLDVRTVHAPLEYRDAPGATTTIVTRAGSDRLTVNVAAEGRPAALRAQDWFDNARGTPQRAGYWNTGGAIGGPLLPTRVQYFVAGERHRITRSYPGELYVPSAAVRAAAPAPIRRVLDSFPLPNGPAVDDAEFGADEDLKRFFATHARRFRADSDLRVVSARIDATLAPRHRLFTRVNVGESMGVDRDPRTHLQAESFLRMHWTLTRTVTAGVTSTLRSWTNDWRVNVSAHEGEIRDGPASASSAKGLPLDLLAPAFAPDATSVLLAFPPFLDALVLAGRPRAARHVQWQMMNTQSWVRGRHLWRYGMNYRQLVGSTHSASSQLSYTFESPAALLKGQLRSLVIEKLIPVQSRRHLWSGFVQDNIRVSDRLSIDLGLRLSRQGAPTIRGALQPMLVRYEGLPRLERLPAGEPFWRASVDAVPQVSATYRLDGRAGRETTVRAGWGVVVDDVGGPGVGTLSDATPFRSRHVLRSATFPLSFEQIAAAPLASPEVLEYYSFAPELRTPRTQHWSVGVDRALGRTHTISLSYVGAVGQHQGYDHAYEYFDPQPIRVQAFSPDGTSSYHGLLVQAVRRLSRGIDARVAWTWSHAIDLNSGELMDHLPPPQNVQPILNKGNADFDRRHVLQVRVSYRPSVDRLPRLLRRVCREWQIDGAGTFQSGAPVSVIVPQRFPYGVRDARPDIVPGVSPWLDDPTSPGGRRLNSDAFVVPTQARQGTLGRNTLRAFPLRQIDLALSRSMRLTTGVTLQIRVEAFNAFNTPNFGPPDGLLYSFYFGRPMSAYADGLGGRLLAGGGLDPLLQQGAPRMIQIAARFNF